MTTQPWLTPAAIAQVQLILDSYHHWFGADLIDRSESPQKQAAILFDAPLVVFSHGTEADPIYNYGSRLGLELWERSWEELLQMPSRQSAEPSAQVQAERNQLLASSRSYGFKTGFSGVRITKSGKRVRIEDVKLWDLLDPAGNYRGQAAVYSKWTNLD
ncbi:MEKHLA domain-containing protein [Picosynechococcus sp. PCC 7117]|uniref:MEKHLA domain-containing protein n=1 Tax=Picosynechococcus sp. PCC 7117 TaxID=195498 RepID=UPI0008105A1F|nr:MEKHLA domain-containing protein [Picosynechococcus sp. PCC 7117]ANV87719.1 MEKHLA domain-containing protein [Picosynechococcus sp. PCC 7117]